MPSLTGHFLGTLPPWFRYRSGGEDDWLQSVAMEMKLSETAFLVKEDSGCEFMAFQASTRGGVLQVRVVAERVFLAGQAVTVCRGELLA